MRVSCVRCRVQAATALRAAEAGLTALLGESSLPGFRLSMLCLTKAVSADCVLLARIPGEGCEARRDAIEMARQSANCRRRNALDLIEVWKNFANRTRN